MNRRAIQAILLILAAVAVYLAGNGRTSLFDRDEPRYAQCSRQMLDSGDWVVPRLYDNIRAAKPPGIYWCQLMAMKVFGENAFAARFPSSLAMILTLAILAIALWRRVGGRRALWTLFIFSSTALVIFAAKMSMTDAVLLLCIVIAQLCIYAMWSGRGGWRSLLGLSVAIGFGGLVKGPFILGVLAGTIIFLAILRGLDRWLSWRGRGPAPEALRRIRPGILTLKILVGIAIVGVIIVPWVLLVNHREPMFLHAATQNAREHLEKGSEGHVGPPGYHLALIHVTYLPWSLLLPLTIVMAFMHRREPQVRFALASVLGAWIFAEILSTKLPHYILPAMPGLAFLTADAIVRCLDGESDALKSLGIRVGAGVIAAVSVGMATVPWWWLAIKFHDFPWAALILLGVVGLAYGFLVWFFFHTRRPVPALITMGVGAMALGVTLFGVYFPVAKPLRLSIRVADVLKEHGVTRLGQAMMLDYKEPSLGFYQGGTIREADHSLPVVRHLQTAPLWLVMTREIWDQATPEAQAQMEIVGAPMWGYNYSDGLRPVELRVVRNLAARN